MKYVALAGLGLGLWWLFRPQTDERPGTAHDRPRASTPAVIRVPLRTIHNSPSVRRF